MREWEYDEFQQTGIDFASEDEVRLYDQKYQKLRNPDIEFSYILKAVSLKPNSIIMEIGAGTGELALRMAKHCKKLIATDVSRTMLAFAQKKAEAQNIRNIEIKHSGFLNVPVEAESMDVVISQLSLHHLPDFWKSVALNNIYRIIKTGGTFFLGDTVLSFDIPQYEATVDAIINFARKNAGEKLAQEITINIRDEYPTYDWIIENMLSKVGFTIDKVDRHSSWLSSFICKK